MKRSSALAAAVYLPTLGRMFNILAGLLMDQLDTVSTNQASRIPAWQNLMRCRIFVSMAALAGLLFGSTPLLAQMDPAAVWPLCGRIAENPPVGWSLGDDCPLIRAGDPNFTDAPFSSTFGPRPLFSGGNRYDFHRGLDLAAPVGTAAFAIADGIVLSAGVHPSYSDPVIRVRHFRPGENSCNPTGCYTALYLHMSGWQPFAANDPVVKGQYLGLTGTSASGFDHLHFEIRDAPPSDPFSVWQRDCVHPFHAFSYQPPTNTTTISFTAIDTSNPANPVPTIKVVSDRYNMVSLALVVKDVNDNPIVQPGDTPNAEGYDVLPPFFNYDTANFQYTHKNSSGVPWSSFGVGGVNECPYEGNHGVGYSAHYHMDDADPGDDAIGLFNGIRTETLHYWPSDEGDYQVTMQFLELVGSAECIEATATFVSGETAVGFWGDCDAAVQTDDFGDLPDSYGTLTASNGPRHLVTAGLGLGATVDLESDGRPGTMADDEGDEEDGVVFSSVSGGAGILNIAATVTGTNTTGGAAMLCGWMDGAADGTVDGDFDRNVTYVGTVGSGTETAASGNEEVCVQVSVAAGGATSSSYPAGAGFNGASASCDATAGDGSFSCTLAFNPNFTVAGTTYARFRLTTDPGFFSNASPSPLAPSPLGAASDGEVEDFEIGFDPTHVTIGDVGLESLSVTDYLNSAERDQLQALLASYGMDADGMDRAALIAALTEFLDPDGDGQVALLHWDTLEERGTIGFYVERQAQGDGQGWSRVNNDLLPGMITAPMGAEYQLLDPGAQPGTRYQYRLIELEADGNTREYGPYTLQMP